MAGVLVLNSGVGFIPEFLSASGYRQGMTSYRFHHVLPVLAVLGSVTALGLGTSIAKQLFPLVGSLGTTALLVMLNEQLGAPQWWAIVFIMAAAAGSAAVN